MGFHACQKCNGSGWFGPWYGIIFWWLLKKCDECGGSGHMKPPPSPIKGPGHVANMAFARTRQRLRTEVERREREKRNLELLRDLHEWFLQSAPEKYKGCGLWIDVEATLKREQMK